MDPKVLRMKPFRRPHMEGFPGGFPGGGVVANAGSNQSITLPTSTVTLSGVLSTGTITSYLWTNVSGPSTPTITSPTSVTTTVTGMSSTGTYIFQLSVNGGVSTSQTQTLVNPAAIVQVQKTVIASTTNSATPSVSFGVAPTSGHLLILAVVSDTTIASTPVGWTVVSSQVSSTGTYMYSKTSDGSETTVNLTLANSDSYCLAIMEYSGVSTLDQTAGNATQGAASPMTSGATATTTAANELLVGLSGISAFVTAATTTWNNSFVSQGSVAATGANVKLDIAVLTVSSTGAYTASVNINPTASANNSMIIATFK